MLNLSFSSLEFSYVYHSPGDSLDEVLLSVSCVCLFVCLFVDFSYVYHSPSDSLDEVLLQSHVFVCFLILVMYIIRPVIASTRCCCQSPVFVCLFWRYDVNSPVVIMLQRDAWRGLLCLTSFVPVLVNSVSFYNEIWQSAVTAMTIMSVCLCVCHTHGLCWTD